MKTLTKIARMNHQDINIGEFDYRDENGKLAYQVNVYGQTMFTVSKKMFNGPSRLLRAFKYSQEACEYVERELVQN